MYRTRLAWWLPRMWVVTRYDDVLSLLKDDRLSKDYVDAFPFVPRSVKPMFRNLLTLDPPDHTRLRSLVHRAFTPRLIERMREDIQRWCDELLDRVAEGETVDLIKAFALPLPMTVISDMLGVPIEERSYFEPAAKIAAAAGSSARLSDFVRAMPALRRMFGYLRELAAKRRETPQDDLISALVKAEDEGDKLTQNEIVSMVSLLLLAGFETTVHVIAGGTLAFLQHPEQRKQWQENPPLTDSGIEEILRYMSPVEFATPRVTREDITLHGVTIPRGQLIGLSLGSANHDESQFEDPESFDIAREPNRHLAFGMGIHFCLGAPLARLEGEIALAVLFRRFPNLRLAVPRESLRWRKSVALRGVRELPVSV